MPRHHALLALGAMGLGWLILTFTIWRLYPDQPMARMLAPIGMGLTAWGLLWFPMEWAHCRGGDAPAEAHERRRMAERVWRRSGWGALAVATLTLLFLERALRVEWMALFALLLLSAELLWLASEPSPERESPLAARRRVAQREDRRGGG